MKHTVFSSVILMLGSARASPAGLKNTFITYRGVDFAKPKILIDYVKACAGRSSALPFKVAELLTVAIKYSGTMKSLIKPVQLTSKDISAGKKLYFI